MFIPYDNRNAPLVKSQACRSRLNVVALLSLCSAFTPLSSNANPTFNYRGYIDTGIVITDDYHAWTGSPPVYKDATQLPDVTGWQRSVIVEYVDPNVLTATVGSDLGVKRVTVTVTRSNAQTTSIQTVVTALRGFE